MSIEFSPAFDSVRGMGASPMQFAAPAASRKVQKRLKPRTHGRVAHATKAASARRVAANRRNAQRSTGPRTPAGKQRASRNAIKHGLCSRYACLDGECAATYATFVREVEEELQPRTAMQRSLVPHIANLMWRIDRLPQAQAEMFELELEKCARAGARGETISASQVIARRFSDEPTRNGFLLIGRYERGLHNQLLRLMSRYEWLKKHRPTPPVDEDEIRAAQREREARCDAYVEQCAREVNEATAREDDDRAKRTQSKPMKNRDGASETAKDAKNDDARGTKRTHRDDDDDDDRSPRAVPNAPRKRGG